MTESDPRRCKTLAEAAPEPDLARAICWATAQGAYVGVPLAEVRQIIAEETARYAAAK